MAAEDETAGGAVAQPDSSEARVSKAAIYGVMLFSIPELFFAVNQTIYSGFWKSV